MYFTRTSNIYLWVVETRTLQCPIFLETRTSPNNPLQSHRQQQDLWTDCNFLQCLNRCLTFCRCKWVFFTFKMYKCCWSSADPSHTLAFNTLNGNSPQSIQTAGTYIVQIWHRLPSNPRLSIQGCLRSASLQDSCKLPTPDTDLCWLQQRLLNSVRTRWLFI